MEGNALVYSKMYEKFEKCGANSHLGTMELVGYCLLGSLSRDPHLLQQEDQPQDFIVGAAELQTQFVLSNVRHLMEKEVEPEKWDGDIWIDICEEKRGYTPERGEGSIKQAPAGARSIHRFCGC